MNEARPDLLIIDDKFHADREPSPQMGEKVNEWYCRVFRQQHDPPRVPYRFWNGLAYVWVMNGWDTPINS